MKIIKQGKIPENKSHQWTCNNCKSVIESCLKEGKITYDQRDGDFVRFSCPVCLFENCVSVSKFT